MQRLNTMTPEDMYKRLGKFNTKDRARIIQAVTQFFADTTKPIGRKRVVRKARG